MEKNWKLECKWGMLANFDFICQSSTRMNWVQKGLKQITNRSERHQSLQTEGFAVLEEAADSRQ